MSDLADGILRKVLAPGNAWDQHYVDLEGGVIDVRVELTDEEIAYCRALGAQPPAG